jgi:myo-inositol catabolism protein IolS
VQYRKLSNTDLNVSVVCFGGMTAGSYGTFGEQDDNESIGAVHAALDAGINFFDTAEGYGKGHSEDVIGRALEGRRDEVVLATKVSQRHLEWDQLVESCDTSLRLLRTECVDIYQVHWPNHTIPFAETVGLLEKLQKAGKIRYWGVSNFGRQDMTDLLACGRPVVDQVPYSLLWRVIEHEVRPICVENGVSIICYSPMAQGLLTGKFSAPSEVPTERARARYMAEAPDRSFEVIQVLREVSEGLGQPMADVALAWVLAQPGIASVLTGVRNAAQIQQNARAADIALPADALERLTAGSDALKETLGTNPDMWNAGERSRYR